MRCRLVHEDVCMDEQVARIFDLEMFWQGRLLGLSPKGLGRVEEGDERWGFWLLRRSRSKLPPKARGVLDHLLRLGRSDGQIHAFEDGLFDSKRGLEANSRVCLLV